MDHDDALGATPAAGEATGDDNGDAATAYTGASVVGADGLFDYSKYVPATCRRTQSCCEPAPDHPLRAFNAGLLERRAHSLGIAEQRLQVLVRTHVTTWLTSVEPSTT